jgi:branched-chain amino acid transport system permease protein
LADFFSGGAGLTFVVYGAIIVVIARFLPNGLLPLFKRKPVAKPDAAEAVHAP